MTMDIYRRIREDNIVKYGTESQKILRIIINQYSDRTHFIYEILQNAEDAGATKISFVLKDRALEIYHNGRPFDEKDIEGVCGIASGTKEDGTRIGHFGIGFKSVYCYTETPRIYSGEYHFEIRDQLFPEEIVPMQGLSFEETCMVLPFDRDDVSEAVAYNEIKDALCSEITSDSIIMLDSIEKVSIEIDGLNYSINIENKKSQIGAIDNGAVFALGSSMITKEGKKNQKEKYNDFLFFSDNKKESSAVVFHVGGDDGRELLPVKNSRIYAFFPTARESHQNFYIHAPFDTTPARDNLKKGEEYGKHNLELVDNLCELITSALIWMRDNGYLSLSGFNTVFPIYEYEKDDILYGIYENSIAIINSDIELLPTNTPGIFKTIENICVPRASAIVDIFSDDDLHKLISSQKFWLAKEIAFENYTALRKFLNENCELQTLDWPALVLRMNASFLKEKKIDWMERLMGRIESYCKKTSYDSRYIDVSQIPLVRTSKGEQICARDNSGRLQVYLNNPDIAKYKINENFLQIESIYSFYANALKIPAYNAAQEVLEKILPYYQTKNVKRTIEENIADLKIIKDAIYENRSICDELSDKYLVSNGLEWFTPSEVYVRSSDIRSGLPLMRGILEINYLAESYFDDTVMCISLDESFFESIGCNSGLRKIKVSKDTYLDAVKKYLGIDESKALNNRIFSKSYISDKFDWAFCYEGFDFLFDDMSFDKSRAIARFLNANHTKFDVQGNIMGANDWSFNGRAVDSMSAYSMIGLYLGFEKWIYVESDDEPHRPIDVERSNIRREYEQSKRAVDILPFKETNEALRKYLEEVFPDPSNRKLIEKALQNPEGLVSLIEAKNKSDARAAKRQEKQEKSVMELLDEGNREQKEKNKPNDDFEVNPISESAISHREESLAKEFKESLEYKTSVTRGIQFTTKSSNKEERQFLLSEYSGHCQICKKQIIKHDGMVYFEAINVVKFGEMYSEYEASGKLGWNSLCLCPNCAAEYNYCSKKISTFYEQVMDKNVTPSSDTPIDIQIELPTGIPRVIHYSPRHFIALKEAFKFLAEKS